MLYLLNPMCFSAAYFAAAAITNERLFFSSSKRTFNSITWKNEPLLDFNEFATKDVFLVTNPWNTKLVGRIFPCGVVMQTWRPPIHTKR